MLAQTTRCPLATGSPLYARVRFSRPRLAVKVAALLDPYRILGVDVLADEAVIKKAYRKLALQCHPDVNRTVDAERHFVELTAAYELLIGKARGKEIQEPDASSWDWHDWYWQFRAQRNAEKQRTGASAGPPPGVATPRHKVEVTSQLAGLRQRSAIRATRQRNQKQQQQEQQQQKEPCTSAPAVEEAVHCSAAASEEQPPSQPQQPEVHADATEAPCDGAAPDLEQSTGVSAGETVPPQFKRPNRMYAGTSDTRVHVANQIVGLRRRAAIKHQAQTV